MLFGLISAGIGAILLLIGVFGLFSPKVRAILKAVPLANKILDPMTWSIVLIIVGFLAGGLGIVTSYVGLSTATITGTSQETVGETVGGFSLKIHDGQTNVSGTAITTEDYYNDADTFLTFYSADVNSDDGNEYMWNITIDRSMASEDAVITVSCNIPDKEISGVTADNLAEKTAGQVDMDINNAGRHSNDNTVYKSFALAEGVITQEVEIAFDQEETYHDGMADLDDYVDIVCTVSDENGAVSDSVTTRVLANS